MASIQEKTLGSKVMLFDPTFFAEPDANLFSRHFWATQNKIIGQAFGRGTTFFFQHQQQEFVLRQYLRGGLVGKVLTNQYLFTGLQRTRAWQEFYLLQLMQQQGLPCPKPVAALVERLGVYYQASIILAKIPNAEDVFTQLLTAPVAQQNWQHIGYTIKRFHQAQIYHHDLNIHNVMLDSDQQAWLIDFDKCSQRTGEQWKQANLDRLYRSLQKERQRKNIYWQQADWKALLSGYNSSSFKG